MGYFLPHSVSPWSIALPDDTAKKNSKPKSGYTEKRLVTSRLGTGKSKIANLVFTVYDIKENIPVVKRIEDSS
jgi:hypothetical protein